MSSSKTVIADLDGRPAKQQFQEDQQQTSRDDPFDEKTLDRIISVDDAPADDDDDLLIEHVEERGPPEEPDEQEEGETEPDDSDEDLKPYSRAVRDRIMRERRLRIGAEEIGIERDRELMVERFKRVSVEKAYIEHALATIKQQLEQTKADLHKAIEDGDSARQVEANARLATLAQGNMQAGEHKLRIEREYGQVTEQAKQMPTHGAGAGENPLATQWRRQNATWFEDPQHEPARVYALAVDKKLATEGWDQRGQGYFRELTRRVAQRFPELNLGPQRQQQRADNRRAPTAGVGSHDAAPPRERQQPDDRRRVQLGTEDYKIMRRFGLDPSNKAAIREFASNKLEYDRNNPVRRRRR